MWGGLAVVTVGQLGYGFVYPIIDQWAHGAGFVTGALVGIAASPHARWSRAAVLVARALALGFAALVVVAGVQVVRTSVADSLAAGGMARRIVDGVELTVPAHWQAAAGQVYQPDGVVIVRFARQAASAPAQQIAMWIAEEGRRSKDGLGELTVATRPVIAMPDGWEGAELEAVIEAEMGARQGVRVLVGGRVFGELMIFTVVEVPDSIARAAPAFFAALLASIRPA
jgi:hypothetical protein